MRRTLIGIITLALLLIAATLYLALPTVEKAQTWMEACLRVGCVMAVLWLAWPQLSRLHPWVVLGGVGVLVAALVLAKQPRILLIGLLILIVVARARRK